jgi:hypothetical protein
LSVGCASSDLASVAPASPQVPGFKSQFAAVAVHLKNLFDDEKINTGTSLDTVGLGVPEKEKVGDFDNQNQN